MTGLSRVSSAHAPPLTSSREVCITSSSCSIAPELARCRFQVAQRDGDRRCWCGPPGSLAIAVVGGIADVSARRRRRQLRAGARDRAAVGVLKAARENGPVQFSDSEAPTTSPARACRLSWDRRQRRPCRERGQWSGLCRRSSPAVGLSPPSTRADAYRTLLLAQRRMRARSFPRRDAPPAALRDDSRSFGPRPTDAPVDARIAAARGPRRERGLRKRGRETTPNIRSPARRTRPCDASSRTSLCRVRARLPRRRSSPPTGRSRRRRSKPRRAGDRRATGTTRSTRTSSSRMASSGSRSRRRHLPNIAPGGAITPPSPKELERSSTGSPRSDGTGPRTARGDSMTTR